MALAGGQLGWAGEPDNGQQLPPIITPNEYFQRGVIEFELSSKDGPLSGNLNEETDEAVTPASLLQPQPQLRPALGADTSAPTPANPFATSDLARSLLSSPPAGLAGSTVSGNEAFVRAATDSGNLVGKSPSATGVGIQRRTPIVTDPRIRGGRVGLLAASGSHWIPARIDLDTAPSKIDSRAIQDIVVIKGPYSALYGPGFQFFKYELLDSPRFDGPASLGSTSFEFKSNGEQFYGREELQGGDQTWGYRFAYGHRTGNDYLPGDSADPVNASYNSRDFELALGGEIAEDSTLEFHYLRLDQTGVEFPGQAFDINYLITDGFEAEYRLVNQSWVDSLYLEGWYNQTTFVGNAQGAGKRKQFPYFDFINFRAFTDVRTISTGYTLVGEWGDVNDQLRLGLDLRVITQRLQEISSGRLGPFTFAGVDSPIPRSQSVNPGFLAERSWQTDDGASLRFGGRVDLQQSQILDPNAGSTLIGPRQIPLTNVYGTSDFDADFVLWSLYTQGELPLTDSLSLTGGVGHGQRPPSLTELFVAQSFMFLLQNGANTVTGDPTLSPERMTQFDFGLKYNTDRTQAYANGFFALARDYITFENLGVVTAPPNGQVEQINLQYVNTNLATFKGVEMGVVHDYTDWLQPFGTLQYVEATDQTRNGHFATFAGTPLIPSTKVSGRPRGFFSGITGGASEPLPGIVPLEGRLGLRLHPAEEIKPWQIEVSARLVNRQNRVATSLLEQPTGGFTIVDIRSFWQYSNGLMLVAGVENVGNRLYREHLDFRSQDGRQVVYQPGVNFYVATELNY